jgi:SAM-dependent methyltransferase
VTLEDLKERQAVVWGAGPYERIEEINMPMHEAVMERLTLRPGERLVDVGCGAGGIALLAARRGADVVGLDLAPVLVESARVRAAAEELAATFEVGDAERLPYGDGEFDVVVSTIGAMFAPDPRAVAAELARVCRPGGRLAFTAWVSESGIGDMFRVVARFRPPPDGVPNPFEWGREDVLRARLGDAFELEVEELDIPYRPVSGEDAWERFSTSFGPVKTTAEALGPEERERFRQAFVDLHEASRGPDGISQERRFLLALGTRR